MQITIYSGFSKEANSTKQPTGGTAVGCTLKENTSIINPVFILQGANFSTNYVSWNGRYYFVDDVVSVRNGAVEVHCSVDVLATYKNEIGSSTQYVVRSASRANNYAIDAAYPLTTDISYSFVTFDALYNHFSASTGGYYVVGVIGQNTGLGVDYYRMTAAEFATFVRYLYGGSFLDAPTTEISIELQKELVNPFQYITSVMWFPCDTWQGTQVSSIPFGFWNATGCSALRLTSLTQRYEDAVTLPNHPQEANTDRYYLYSNPYTRLNLSCFTFGDMALDASNFIKERQIALQLIVDYATGVGTLGIFARQTSGAGVRIQLVHGQVGVPMQISQITQNLVQSAVGVVGAAIAGVTGNFIGTASGLGDAVNGLLPQTTTKGTMSSRVAFMYTPSIVCTFRNITSADTVHLGKPTMQHLTINTLSGFVQVEEPDVNITGTPAEKNKIAGYMQSGFFYE